MFLKIFAIILGFGVIGCMLLVNRQQQIEAAHEMSKMHRRLSEQERVIWDLRAQISERISPEKLQRARAALVAEWQPIVLREWPGTWTQWSTDELPLPPGENWGEGASSATAAVIETPPEEEPGG